MGGGLAQISSLNGRVFGGGMKLRCRNALNLKSFAAIHAFLVDS